MTCGSRTFQSTGGRMLTPTRRRVSTRPIEESTRSTSRMTAREAPNRLARSSMNSTDPAAG